jgi:hypothetical protein
MHITKVIPKENPTKILQTNNHSIVKENGAKRIKKQL